MDTKVLKLLKFECDDLNNQTKALKTKMQAKSRDLMVEGFKEFFTRHGEHVQNLFWTQYTPHFNDGEECSFGVSEVYILLKGDEEACEYEGSLLYDQEKVVEIENDIATTIAWQKDPIGTAQKYANDYFAKYKRDLFQVNTWDRETVQQKMEKWTPSRQSIVELNTELLFATQFVSKSKNLKEDFEHIKRIVESMDDDMMKMVFGNHVKVIVSNDSLEVEEYDHD